MTSMWLLHVLLLVPAATSGAADERQIVDLLEAGAESWRAPDPSRWSFVDGEIHGKTPVLNGANEVRRHSAR